MAQWTNTVFDYHSTSDEAKSVFHYGGKTAGMSDWVCPDGGRIFVEHLAESRDGADRKACEKCLAEYERRHH